MSVAIIEYGMGNVRSVANAFEEIGVNSIITDDPADIKSARAVVLPGVGAFKKGIENLQDRNLIDVLNTEVITKKRPFLGICLGMQLLATHGYEHGKNRGLGWIPGKVVQIEPQGKEYRIPHMGWNEVSVLNNQYLFEGLGNNPVFYFVHGFHLKVDKNERDVVTSTCWHGEEIVASVHLSNIMGVQFHPEKSQRAGLKLISNFVEMMMGSHDG
jgi:glutamine amidotransferase